MKTEKETFNHDKLYHEHGLSLITHLLETALEVSIDNLGEASKMLLELTQITSSSGQSFAERVVAYFAKARYEQHSNKLLAWNFLSIS